MGPNRSSHTGWAAVGVTTVATDGCAVATEESGSVIVFGDSVLTAMLVGSVANALTLEVGELIAIGAIVGVADGGIMGNAAGATVVADGRMGTVALGSTMDVGSGEGVGMGASVKVAMVVNGMATGVAITNGVATTKLLLL